MILEKKLKKKKDSQKGNNFFYDRACFGWVGRSMANQIKF